jgi:hypothetical protein
VAKTWKIRTGHAACPGEMRNRYKFSVTKPGGKRQHRGTGCRWKYSMKMILKNLCDLLALA